MKRLNDHTAHMKSVQANPGSFDAEIRTVLAELGIPPSEAFIVDHIPDQSEDFLGLVCSKNIYLRLMIDRETRAVTSMVERLDEHRKHSRGIQREMVDFAMAQIGIVRKDRP